jgi:hypothetical protein
MNDPQKLSSELRDIKQMMERSSRFISLSGLSGVCAGICGLIAAWLSAGVIEKNKDAVRNLKVSIADADSIMYGDFLNSRLFQIALITLVAAITFAFIFTYRRSKVTRVPIWGVTAKRMVISIAVPVLTGGIFLLALIKNGVFGFVAPGCLIFYGLGVLNASKYTLPETGYLGYCEILLGLINLMFLGQGLYFWAAGFGLLHIFYGAYMWWKYERNQQQ